MITLDINDDAVKVLQIEGKSITRAVTQPLEAGLVKDGVVINPAVVGQIIRDLFNAHGIVEHNVIASVGGIHSIYRVTKLPKLSADLMQEAAKRETGRLVPVSLESVYTSWQAIPENNAENIIPIAAVPRETIDSMLAALKTANISTKLMDLRPLAIAHVADEPNALIINIQPSCFDIVLMIDGVPRLLRSLSFTDTNSSSEAKIAEIKAELERTVDFYNSSNPSSPLAAETPAFISGVHKELMAEVLSYPVKPLPQLLLYPEGFNADEYVTNIGLALKGSKGGKSPVKINMNVVPQIFLPKPVPLFNVLSWVFVLLAAIMLMFMVVNVIQVTSRNAQLRSQIKALSAQVETAKGNKAKIDELNAQLQQIEKERDNTQKVLQNLSEEKDIISKDLGEIVSRASGRATLSTIGYGNGWTVVGTANDSSIVVAYAFDLQNSNRFSLVQINSMQEVSSGVWNFNLKVNR